MLVLNSCRWPAALVLALCCSTSVAALAAAQEYVSGAPEPARVLAAYERPDSLDRTAQQHAALTAHTPTKNRVAHARARHIRVMRLTHAAATGTAV